MLYTSDLGLVIEEKVVGVPETYKSEIHTMLNDSRADRDLQKSYTWHSDDGKFFVSINEDGFCQQSGIFDVKDSSIYFIVFPYDFNNCNYVFFIENFGVSVEKIEKTPNGVRLFLTEVHNHTKIRWLAVGVIV